MEFDCAYFHFGGVDHGSVDRGRGYKRLVGCRELISRVSG